MKLFVATLSPQSDEPTPVYGCTDPDALNYNPLATHDDGSCVYPVYGCTDPDAINYDPNATHDDGSCIYAPEDGCFVFPATFTMTFEENCS